MWFLYASLAAIVYTLLWIFTRLSRGMPSSVVTALEFSFGPFLLLYTTQTVDFPWSERWWQLYLIFPFFILPLIMWMLTYALHRNEVSSIKPLFGFSSVSALIAASLFFGETITAWSVLGVLIITLGLFCLYHGRWESWRHYGPWIVLACAILVGVNGAVLVWVFGRFPHFLAVAALSMTSIFIFNAVIAGRAWARVSFTPRRVGLLVAPSVIVLLDNIFTLSALSLGPSASVIAVKRSSILLTSIVAYVFLKERSQSLPRLLVASGLVVVGVVLLTVS